MPESRQQSLLGLTARLKNSAALGGKVALPGLEPPSSPSGFFYNHTIGLWEKEWHPI